MAPDGSNKKGQGWFEDVKVWLLTVRGSFRFWSTLQLNEKQRCLILKMLTGVAGEQISKSPLLLSHNYLKR